MIELNRAFRFAAGAIALLVCTDIASAEPPGGSRPNIIHVMPHDTGYGDYACLGNPVIHTPVVDALQKESLLFAQFHVNPTCSPCRAAMMSGRHEFKNGVTHTIGGRERMSLETFTLAQMLKSAGYTTGIFGKWHLGDQKPYRSESRGFDEVYIHGSGGIGQAGDAPGNTNIDPTLWHNDTFEKTKGYCTDLFFAQALRWMNIQREANQPFFAYIPLNAAHAPHVLPKDDYQQYLGKPDVKQETAKFLGMVENVDTNFGVLLAKIKEWGIADNTLLMVYCAIGKSIMAKSLADGKTMWTAPAGENYMKSTEIFVADGLVWGRDLTGRDPKTGKVVRTLTQETTGPMSHDRCYRNRNTHRYYLNSATGGTDFLALDGSL